MAQSYVTDAGVLVIPGAYPTVKVQGGASGLSTTGVIFLVGEADGGTDFTLETDLTENAFGPDQAADVVSKYVSGPARRRLQGGGDAGQRPRHRRRAQPLHPRQDEPVDQGERDPAEDRRRHLRHAVQQGLRQLGNLSYFNVVQKTAEEADHGCVHVHPARRRCDISLRVNGGAAVRDRRRPT
jgi:hypothetical protein